MGPSRVAQAKIMYERVITGRGTTLGKEHPQTLIVMNHLANLLQVTDLPPPPPLVVTDVTESTKACISPLVDTPSHL